MSYPNRKTARTGTTRRVRMLGHDYSYPGYYFVTFCTSGRQQLFGQIVNHTLHLSQPGQMVQAVVSQCGSRYKTVVVDSHVVMPNHVHVLFGLAIRTDDVAGIDNVSEVVRWVKNTTAQHYSHAVKTQNWEPYEGRVWQKGFHDHVVRDDRELETFRTYIATNIDRWEDDTFFD